MAADLVTVPKSLLQAAREQIKTFICAEEDVTEEEATGARELVHRLYEATGEKPDHPHWRWPNPAEPAANDS